MPSTSSLWPAAKKSAKDNKLAGPSVEPRKPRDDGVQIFISALSKHCPHLVSFGPFLLSIHSLFIPSSLFFLPISFIISHPPCQSFLLLYIPLPLSILSPCFLFFFSYSCLPQTLVLNCGSCASSSQKDERQDSQTLSSSEEPDLSRTLSRPTLWFRSNFQMFSEHSTEQEVASPNAEWARPLVNSHLPGQD